MHQCDYRFSYLFFNHFESKFNVIKKRAINGRHRVAMGRWTELTCHERKLTKWRNNQWQSWTAGGETVSWETLRRSLIWLDNCNSILINFEDIQPCCSLKNIELSEHAHIPHACTLKGGLHIIQDDKNHWVYLTKFQVQKDIIPIRGVVVIRAERSILSVNFMLNGAKFLEKMLEHKFLWKCISPNPSYMYLWSVMKLCWVV